MKNASFGTKRIGVWNAYPKDRLKIFTEVNVTWQAQIEATEWKFLKLKHDQKTGRTDEIIIKIRSCAPLLTVVGAWFFYVYLYTYGNNCCVHK